MKTKIDVSVIIPAYNAAGTVGTLVSKILREQHVSVELIVVDDGSTDDTANIVKSFRDERLILIEQENQGVYAARNTALAIHRGEWVIFLDADDDISDEFIGVRWRTAAACQADVVIFNAWYEQAGSYKKAVHRKQPYGHCLSGHEWLRHCVIRREWPHYLWLQMVSSTYIRQHALSFQPGKSHKDIIWTVNLAVKNGRFCVTDIRDYTYIFNTVSITHREDYFDIRALSYVDVIAEILHLAEQPENRPVKLFLLRHALVETRHFLGLYRRKVRNKLNVKVYFRENIPLMFLFKGTNSFSDIFFFIKLARHIL